MKKILSLLLLLALFLPLCSCSATLEPTPTEQETVQTEEKKTTEEAAEETCTEPYDYPKISEPVTWAKIKAIPIANERMTEAELRQICLDFFRLSLTFQWTPAENYTYSVNGKKVTLKKGDFLAGVPYVAENAGGSLYSFLRYYDPETGILDLKGTKAAGVIPTLGTHCSSGAFWGWARVVNSIPTNYATVMYHHEQGFLRVGEYKYFESGDRWDRGANSTRNCCTANGKSVMYDSYAALRPADGLLLVIPGGMHVRMAVSVNVVKNEDGAIDGKKSTVTFLDQGSSWEDKKTPQGESVSVQGGVDETESFEKLYKTGYVPFTFGEFLGTDPVEAPTATLGLEGSEVSWESFKSARLRSNYFLGEGRITLYNNEGGVIFSDSASAGSTFCLKSMRIDRLFMKPDTQKAIKNAARVVVEAYLATGETITVFDGKVVSK